jgi:hypothetical protein
MTETIIDALASEIGKFLTPLARVLDDRETTDRFLAEIGASADNAGGDSLVNALRSIAALGEAISAQASQQSAASFREITALLEQSRNTFKAIEALSESNGPASDLQGFGHDLVDLLIVAYLAGWHPLARDIAALLTLIEPAETQIPSPAVVNDNDVVRMPFLLDRVHLERLPVLLRDPVGTLRAYYWNELQTKVDADAIADKLFVRVRNVLKELDVDCRYGIEPSDVALFGDEAALIDHGLLVYSSNQLTGADVDAGIVLTLSPAEYGDLGLVVSPFGVIEDSVNWGLWKIDFQLAADLQAFAIGRNGPTLLASAQTVELDAKITATLDASNDGPAFVFGSPTSSRLEVGGALLTVALKLSGENVSGELSASVSKSVIAISAGDGDGFLQSVLPAGGLKADFDLGLTWSNARGLSFSGAAGLDATLPVGISIGGVITIPTIHLGLQAGDTGLLIEVSASIGLSIGPIQALVDRLGLNANVTFPDKGGNLGIADLDFGFKLPSGVGLSIDSGGVTGAGVLSRDPAKHEYSGMLQLEFDDVALQAFGLITTQVVGGRGYSLLALVDADFPPIQLGWGFTLNGVGGLLAVHRTADADALHAALKANKLSTVLFPKTAISNAPLVLAQLDALFPTAHGRFLFGPMALIGWGSPKTLLTVALAVILELPEPIRIILIARLAALLPSPSAPLVRINMDALGIVDFAQAQLSLDAKLYDSKLMTFALSGDMALRVNWGSQREFLLAVGGFHPLFAPPVGFPALQRMTIAMSVSDIGKLRLASYFAITSNTLQFGAEIDVSIGVSDFGLTGHLAFDAMLQIDPFHFDADISGSIALTIDGDSLMSVSLDAKLSGPAPWHITGNFKIHILVFDVHKSFSATWGDNTPQLPIKPVDVLPLLQAAFADSRNWGAQLPANAPSLLSLRSQGSSVVIAHPLALLEVRQSIVPLDLEIMRFGAATISGATTFKIKDITVGKSSVFKQSSPVQDDFAPAQFFNLSDEEKLSGPSFEKHDSGVLVSGWTTKSGPSVPPKFISFETEYVDTLGGAPPAKSIPSQPLSFAGKVPGLLSIGSSARGAIWSAGKRRFKAPGKPVSVTPLKFTVVSTDTLTSAGIAPVGGVTYTAAKALMANAIANHPGNMAQLQIVGIHEMAAS